MQFRVFYFSVIVAITIFSCNTEIPLQLSEEAVNEEFLDINNNSISLKNILQKHQNKQIVIDVWASWCRDCIVDLPNLKKLQKQFPNANYVSLSMDRNKETWKRAIKKLNLKGEHYFMTKGWDGEFADFMDLDWIPRYMILDADGNIKFYEAVKAKDEDLVNYLNGTTQGI